MADAPFTAWVRERPAVIQRMMINWPPDAEVKAKEGEVLKVPAPGVTGRVASWFENGDIGVEAALPTAITNPRGDTFEAGEVLRGACDPSQLEVVGYATYGETVIDHDLIRSIVEPNGKEGGA